MTQINPRHRPGRQERSLAVVRRGPRARNGGGNASGATCGGDADPRACRPSMDATPDPPPSIQPITRAVAGERPSGWRAAWAAGRGFRGLWLAALLLPLVAFAAAA